MSNNADNSDDNGQALAMDFSQTPEVASDSSEGIVIFVGNLRPDIDQTIVNRRLQVLFASRGVQTKDEDFSMLRRGPKKAKHLFVVLKSEDERHELINSFNGLPELDFVVESKCLRVREKKCQKNMKYRKMRTKTDISNLEQNPKEKILGLSKSAPNMTTTKPNGLLRFEGKALRVGQILENENRRTEYKRGGGRYLKKVLINHVRRYVCAFLNSEGGKLHVGVADNGKVYGVPCTRKQEDSIRILIDNIISKFQPPVFPTMYSVRFIPVIQNEADYETTDYNDQCFKVLEIEVFNQPMTKTLYETDKGDVYIRRDGSVQGPLKASQIIEWCRFHQANATEVQKQETSKLTNKVESKDPWDTSDTEPVNTDPKLEGEPLTRISELEASLNTRQAELEKEINALKLSYEMRERLLQEELEKSRFELQRRRRPNSAVCVIL